MLLAITIAFFDVNLLHVHRNFFINFFNDFLSILMSALFLDATFYQ